MLLEFGHDLRREELQRLADMLVAVVAALLNEGDLVDTRLRETAQMLAQLIGRTDAARTVDRQLVLRLLEMSVRPGLCSPKI